MTSPAELLARGVLADPHGLLGAHIQDGRMLVRVWAPDAPSVAVRLADRDVVAARIHPAGLWEADGGPWTQETVPAYRVLVGSELREDPYRFWPTVGELDLHLLGEGRHESLWRVLGAHAKTHQHVDGVAFAVWAPNARAVRVVGDWNAWDSRVHPMRTLGRSGVWELFVPAARPGDLYKFELLDSRGSVVTKADPCAASTEVPPRTASRIFRSSYEWSDSAWIDARAATSPLDRPLSIYEVHLGSWRPGLSYRDAAVSLVEYVASMGFTHVELMPVAEHPFGGSWGYQVTSYFAPTSRFGTPDEFRSLVDAFHRRGIGVIVDWVPAHFPRDSWALARFDGTPLYEHADPRQGEHPDWGTLVFNFGRNEVANFLLASAQAWIEDFHVDGLRVDAVASMLYLDYSRAAGEWVPNRFGGRENLAAVDFLRHTNEVIHRRYPGAVTIAEESTAWPGVSRPPHAGGLGFTFKWNMGWMHDTLTYFSHEPVHRRHHHHDLTFGLSYAFSENFILPLSHDEVVHGKGSLVAKMPGDHWQQMANLRALLAWMWAHPGGQLLFMGAEIGQEREWSDDRGVDWDLLRRADHEGLQTLVRTLNVLMRRHPPLWEVDYAPDGFRWITADDADNNVLAFARLAADGVRSVVCVANLSPVVRHAYRVGVTGDGTWHEILSTDAPIFGGSGVVNGAVRASRTAPGGSDWSVALTLPPLGVLWLAREGEPRP
ncbi:MAG: 1,4-alpha-glucan branching protein GlgB [Acidimicrobiales bacterium]